MTATNRDLAEEVRAGRFRADLFHRLAVYPLRVPPLRDRPDDIAPLVGHFVDQTRAQLGAGKVRVTEAFLERLQQHDFPGNVRELENVVSRAVLRAASRAGSDAPVIVELVDLGSDLSPSALGSTPPTAQSRAAEAATTYEGPLRRAVDRFQRELIQRTVAQCGGNWSKAAVLLQLNRANLYHLAVRLGLK